LKLYKGALYCDIMFAVG